MAWTCEQTEDLLLEALDRTLPPAQQARMDRHLADCAKCTRLLGGVRQTIDSLHHLEPVEPAPWVVPGILARTSGLRPQRKHRWTNWLDFLTQPRFALGLVAVLITFSVLFRALAGVPPTSLAALNPLELYRKVDSRAHLVYAHGVKFISDLRLVYEIQSTFQSPSSGEHASSPEKKNTDQLQRLLYQSVESRLRRARTPVPGEQNEMRYPS